jgi:hypothetical protein
VVSARGWGVRAPGPTAARFFFGSQRYWWMHLTSLGQSASVAQAPTIRDIEQRKQVQARQNEVGTQVASLPQVSSSHELAARQYVSLTDWDVQSDPGGQGTFGGGSQ